MKKSVSEVFRALRAPLANARWSWGAIRPSDGAVCLRVWQDRTASIGGKLYVQLTHRAKYQGGPKNLGFQERLRHVEAVRAGAPCYLVMCEAEEPEASPRKIKSINHAEIFVGGEVIQHDGDDWIALGGRKPASEV